MKVSNQIRPVTNQYHNTFLFASTDHTKIAQYTTHLKTSLQLVSEIGFLAARCAVEHLA